MDEYDREKVIEVIFGMNRLQDIEDAQYRTGMFWRWRLSARFFASLFCCQHLVLLNVLARDISSSLIVMFLANCDPVLNCHQIHRQMRVAIKRRGLWLLFIISWRHRIHAIFLLATCRILSRSGRFPGFHREPSSHNRYLYQYFYLVCKNKARFYFHCTPAAESCEKCGAAPSYGRRVCD